MEVLDCVPFTYQKKKLGYRYTLRLGWRAVAHPHRSPTGALPWNKRKFCNNYEMITNLDLQKVHAFMQYDTVRPLQLAVATLQISIMYITYGRIWKMASGFVHLSRVLFLLHKFLFLLMALRKRSVMHLASVNKEQIYYQFAWKIVDFQSLKALPIWRFLDHFYPRNKILRFV